MILWIILFGGFIIGLVTLAGGTGLALYLYFKTKKHTDDSIDKFKNIIKSEPNSSGFEVTD